jgi:hypothetical protein
MNLTLSTDDVIGLGRLNGGESVQTVFRHEVGHALQTKLIQNAIQSGKIRNMMEFENIASSRKASYWSKKVSEYATVNSKELFAESFAAFTHPSYGSKGNKLPAELHNFFSNILTKG